MGLDEDEAPSPKALCANLRGNAVGKGGGVYPSVTRKSVRKEEEIKGIGGFSWDDDGDERTTSD
jgi:hypothetical protein